MGNDLPILIQKVEFVIKIKINKSMDTFFLSEKVKYILKKKKYVQLSLRLKEILEYFNIIYFSSAYTHVIHDLISLISEAFSSYHLTRSFLLLL